MTGMPAYAVTPTPAVTPGTISNGIPAGGKRQRLLGPAPEDQRVSTLEPDHATPRSRMVDQELVDLVLGQRAMTDRLAGADPHGLGRRQIEQARTGQMVVHDHIGAGEKRPLPDGSRAPDHPARHRPG